MRVSCANRPPANLGAQPLRLGGSRAALLLTSLVTLQSGNPERHDPGTQERSFSGQQEPVPASRGSPAPPPPPQVAVSSSILSKNSTAQVKSEPFLLFSTATLLAVLAPWGKI